MRTFHSPLLRAGLLALSLATPALASAQALAFPGAQGFGANASGGRGGQVLFVTNTNVNGPGSLQAALDTPGPKYVLFRVSGVIDGVVEIPSGSEDVTIAGQTSPMGIVMRGIRSYNDVAHSTDNLIIRHIRSRSGVDSLHPTANEVLGDGISLGGVHRAIIDHCSFAQNVDEAVDVSRSSELSIQDCILAETWGEHYDRGGLLTNYNAPNNRLDSLSIHHNAWIRVGGRMPEFSCESGNDCDGHTLHAEISQNLWFSPHLEMTYNQSIVAGQGGPNTFHLALNIENNYSHARPTHCHGLFQMDLLNHAANQFYLNANSANVYPGWTDYQLFGCCDDFCTTGPNTDPGAATHLSARLPYPSINPIAPGGHMAYVCANVGAFPRDAQDTRLVGYVCNDQIPALHDSLIGADDPFTIPTTTAGVPADGDNDGMPDYWENIHGLNPAVMDHNGTTISQTVTGVTGYTNLEVYLNCLADALVHGTSSACGIVLARGEAVPATPAIQVFPNPSNGRVRVELPAGQRGHITIRSIQGAELRSLPIQGRSIVEMDLSDLPKGIYLVQAAGAVRQLILQ